MSEENEKKEKEYRDVAAYYIAQKGLSYDELCWLLAEKQTSGEKPVSETSDDALKFFINWITEMIDLGGANLPKTISSRLGAKLGSIYKNRGITTIEEGLQKSYAVLNGVSELRRDDNTIEVTTQYIRNFCPIGGNPNPERADLIQSSICVPFTIAFLTSLDPSCKYTGTVKDCILKTSDNKCCYSLKVEEKITK